MHTNPAQTLNKKTPESESAREDHSDLTSLTEKNSSVVIQCQTNNQSLHYGQNAIHQDQSMGTGTFTYPATISTWAGLASHGPAREADVTFPQAAFGPM